MSSRRLSNHPGERRGPEEAEAAEREGGEGGGIGPLISAIVARGIGAGGGVTFAHGGGIFTYGARARLKSRAD